MEKKEKEERKKEVMEKKRKKEAKRKWVGKKEKFKKIDKI